MTMPFLRDVWPCGVQLLCELHEYDFITRWTLSDDKRVFAFSRDDGVVVYLVSPHVSGHYRNVGIITAIGLY